MKISCETEVDKKKAEGILKEIQEDSMGGWYRLPLEVDNVELMEIKRAAAKIREDSEVLVCIGIGGSYLGHRAVIEALEPKDGVEIIYAGNSLSSRELERAVRKLGDRSFSINVISKSGTTLEPARAFERFKEILIAKYGNFGAAERIYATTDKEAGALHDEAVAEGYHRFVVPDNIGGRYSVLTAVGLLPIAAAGVDIDLLLSGAAEEADKAFKAGASSEEVRYAFYRQELYSKGFDTEVFASFEPCMMYFNEWLKQLFGESEGKEKQGIWPASVVYSTDLHSLGQFMQDGRRNLWETIIDYPTDEVNRKVVEAVKIAHKSGGIPVITVEDLGEAIDAKMLGGLIYFFELSCAISAKLAGVNPFDQPGVEAYKKELMRLLAE